MAYITHSAHIPGNLAKADDVNQNDTNTRNQVNGNLDASNLTTLTSVVAWAIPGATPAMAVSVNGGSALAITQTGLMGSGVSTLSITDSTNHLLSSGAKGSIYIDASSATTRDVPLINLVNESIGLAIDITSTTKGVRFPRMTEVQRDAIAAPDLGEVLFNTDADEYQCQDSEGWASMGMPAGVVLDFAGATAPDGFLACDGAEYDPAIYPRLYAAISTTWNTGGETPGYFRVPNSEDRTAVGAGSAYSLSDTGGSATQSLSIANLAAHDHGAWTSYNATGISVPSSGAHSHNVYLFAPLGVGTPPFSQPSSGTGANQSVTQWVGTANNGGSGHTHSITDPTHRHGVSSQGSGTAHNNLQPYIAFNKIIKT